MRETKFTWVKTHSELVEFMRKNRNQQNRLIETLKKVGISGLHDEKIKGQREELNEIDPFSFFCYIYKYGNTRRLKYLQEIAKAFNITIPADDNGIPSVNAQKVCLFPFEYSRNNNEINRLWNIFENAFSDSITDDQFEDVLKIMGTGKTKLTEGLFNILPKKYFPINGPTIPYLKEVLGIEPKFKTFSDYLNILKQIKQKSPLPYYELSYEAWKWNDERKNVNYWIFQGNPNVFDFETALRNEILSDWTVSAHKEKIKVGDKVIVWITGRKSGCYALAEVTSELHKKTSSPDDHLWKNEDKSSLKVGIKISHNLIDNPILDKTIKAVEELKNLKVGNQGTNFSASEEEYQALLGLSQNNNEKQYWLYAPGENAKHWEEFYNASIIGLGWDEIGDLKQYHSRDDIKKALVNAYGGNGSKKNDVSANDDFQNKINIGDVIIAKKGRGVLLGYGIVTSNYEYDKNRSEHQKVRQVDWKLKGNWKVDFSLVLKTLTDITKYSSDHANYETYYERLLGIMKQDSKTQMIEEKEFPLNTILYGPPGTGKTYNTVLRAAEIVEDRKIKNYDEALEIFKANLHDQIEFITFHQNYSYEDFIQGLRPDTENDKQLTFERKDGVFKVIADKALKNISDSNKPPIAKKTFEVTFNEFVNPLVQGEIEEIEVQMKKVSYFITAITNKSIEFRKSSGGTAHTLSISTLKKMYEGEELLDIQGLSSYYTPLLDELLKIGKDSSGKKEIVQRKNYVIIIDEINRANISRVFGELITLIEPDKRSNGKIPMEAKLPSGDIFMVPSNLYIIGTMNTADKSIALLDIALRRRFEFEAMYPKYEIEDQEIYDVDILKKINEQVITSKGHDFQIGHAYFMGDNTDLLQRMNKKVIPLLLEYYMNDDKEVREILQKAGLKVEEGSWPLRITGRND